MYPQKPMLGTQLDWSNPLNKGLVMHLAMNEGHGDRIQDLSLNGNHGKLENFAYPPTHESGWGPGKDGIGLNFDYIDDYVGCGDAESLQSKKAVTIDVRFATFDDGANTICRCGSHEWDLYILHGSCMYTWLHTADKQSNWHSNYLFALNTLHHVILTGSTTSGVFTHYINGVKYKNGNGFTGDLVYTAPLKIGSGFTRFNGFIDQVRILNRAYTAKEVLERYINPNGVYLEE